jgi:aliphatic nitrilase
MARSTERRYQIALAHAASEYLDLDGSIAKACALIEEAGRAGARLVVFPEVFLPGYPFWIWLRGAALTVDLFAELFEQSVELAGDPLRPIGAAARRSRTWVCMGASERDGGTLYNTLVWFDDRGELVARHRKLQPTNAERTIWGSGDGRDVFVLDTPLGRLGGLICFEHTMDLNRYSLTARGEQVHVAAWPPISALTGDPYSRKCDAVTDAAIKYHAFAGQTFVASVQGRIDEQVIDRLGLADQPDQIRVGGGHCAIVAPDTSYVAGPQVDDEMLVYGEIDLGMIAYAKYFVDTAGHYSRGDIFKLSVDQRPQTVLGEQAVQPPSVPAVTAGADAAQPPAPSEHGLPSAGELVNLIAQGAQAVRRELLGPDGEDRP